MLQRAVSAERFVSNSLRADRRLPRSERAAFTLLGWRFLKRPIGWDDDAGLS